MFRTRRALKLFYFYAHEDELLREELEKALALLRRQHYIEGWHDRQITAGQDWAGEIDAHLVEADIVLLLISPDFMASDYCAEIELQTALQRHAEGVARVVPILLRPTDWETSDIARLQCLPVGARPITTWNNQDAAFTNVAQGIRKIVGELQRAQPVSADPHGAEETTASVWSLARRHGCRSCAAAVVLLALVAMAYYAWSWSKALATQGEAWLDVGDYQQAASDFQLASGWNPFNRRAREGTLVSKVALARHDEVQFRRGMAALAASLPENPHVRLLAGHLAYYENRAGDALQDYEAASTRRPSLSEAYFGAGVVLRNRGSMPEAEAAFQRAIAANPLAPAIPRYSNNRAFCLVQLGRGDEALQIYGQNTQYPLSALEASRLLLARGELRQARDFVQRAVDWLGDNTIAALAQNQGPWDFETQHEGIRLAEQSDKLCYAQMQLAVTMFLLGAEQTASDMIQHLSCTGVMTDVLAIVHWDLTFVRQANAAMAPRIEAFRAHILEPLGKGDRPVAPTAVPGASPLPPRPANDRIGYGARH